ncbi:Hypothetical protein GL50581_410 [Giardia duodenalis ATCC 50581]|nr:Hypothetical protein GL50581_410 [Giardia intestinalis ATCC 50581]
MTIQQYYTVVLDKKIIDQHRDALLNSSQFEHIEMPALLTPNFDRIKNASQGDEDEQQQKPNKRYKHWSFVDNLQLLIQFIVLESLDFSKVQELFQQRDIHSCRVKWTNDLIRFNSKGVNYSWKTFMVAVVLDFHSLVAIKSHPAVKKHFPEVKEKVLTTLYSVDYPCFMTSTDYRKQIAKAILSIYEQHVSLEELEESPPDEPKGAAASSFYSKMKTNSFSILQETRENTKAYEQLMREIKRKASKLVIE